MTRCEILRRILILGGIIALRGGVLQADEQKDPRPNIILCMADDQGWGDVGYAGHPAIKTPNLDAMAAAGLRFTQFHAAAPVCSPTRGSVMTGRHPNRYGCFSWGLPLRPQETTIAQVLKATGYVTGHFGKWHLGSVQKGSPVNPGACGFDEWLSAPNFYDNDPILSREGIAVQLKGESSMVAMDAAIAFIRKHAKEPRPFFAVVWFGSPHVPCKASQDTLSRYPDQPENLRHYYGEISGIDDAMGRLRSELGKLDIRANTLLWYCSDNGGLSKISATGGRACKASIYEGGLRVPAILEWPARIPKPAVTDLPANTTDMFVTLAELANARPQNQRPLDGTSLCPLIAGQMKVRPKPMGFWAYPSPGKRTPSDTLMLALLNAQKNGNNAGDSRMLFLDADKIVKRYSETSFPGHAAWLDWPWKYHRIEDKDGRITAELYNLAEDQQESVNQIDRQPEKARTMRADLEKWLASVAASLNGKDY
jgi:arylsulfatase A-like enzyme